MTNMAEIIRKVNGASFAAMDTEVNVPLTGGQKNPMQGRVTKRTTGSRIMLFQNKSGSAYAAMIGRRLAEENKDPADFKLSPRAWGDRLPNLPMVRHTKDGVTKYYLEAIFLAGGESEYFLDGEHIDKCDIVGLKPAAPAAQGGLDRKVIIRTFMLDSLRELRVAGERYTGPFVWDGDAVISQLAA